MNITINSSNKKRVTKKNAFSNEKNLDKEFNKEENIFERDISNGSEEKINDDENSDITNKERTLYNSLKDRKINSKKNFKKNNNKEEEKNNSSNNISKNYFDSQNNLNNNTEINGLFLSEYNITQLGEKSDKSYIKYELINHYKNWSGSNYFIYRCHMLEGPCNFRPTLLTGCIATIPLILFLTFDFKYIKNELSISIPIIIIIVYIIALIYMLIASFIDPGIIRRFNYYNENKMINATLFRRIKIKVFHLGYITSYKFCPTCKIIRPNRSTHCIDCNNCVERLDHHCPWIGNCTGKRNYKYFFIFLTLFNILCILIIIFCIIYIIKKVKDYIEINNKLEEENKIKNLKPHAFCDVIVSLYLIIYCVLTMFFITGLLIYHINLVIKNSTTKEQLRKVFKNKHGNPYKRNICTNIKNIFFPMIKKYTLLDILRGDIREICDTNNTNNVNILSEIKNEENLGENDDTQQKINVNKIYENFKKEIPKPINENFKYDINNINSEPINEDYGYDIKNNNFRASNEDYGCNINSKNDKSKEKYNELNNNYHNTERGLNNSTNFNDKKDNGYKRNISKSCRNQKVLISDQNTEIESLKNDCNINYKFLENNLDYYCNDKLEEYLKNFGTDKNDINK